MASRTLPGLALKGFWTLGEDNYKDDMDLNLLKLSVVTDGGVIDKVAALPGSPTDGNVYVLDETAGGGNANKIAVRDNGAWVYFAPNEGWMTYNRTEDEFIYYDGTLWSTVGTSLPAFDIDDAGRVLTVKLDGTGYEWAELPGGGPGGDTVYPTAAKWRIIADAAGSDGVNVGFGEIQWIDKFGDQIFDSGTINASSDSVSFPLTDVIDANYDVGNGWMANIPTIEDAVGAWWEQTWIAPHEVAGVMLYPIAGDFDSAPEAFRAQYYDDDLADWVDAGTFTHTWDSDSQIYFPFDGVPATVEIDLDAQFGTTPGSLIIRGATVWEALAPPPSDTETYKLTMVDGVATWVLDTGGAAVPHSIGFGFGPGPEADEIVFTYVFVENVQWADECAGSEAHMGAVCTATYNLKIQKNGSDIGVVQFQNTPSISFGITGSSPIDWAPGDVLTVVGAATPDATLAEVAVTFYGTRTA